MTPEQSPAVRIVDGIPTIQRRCSTILGASLQKICGVIAEKCMDGADHSSGQLLRVFGRHNDQDQAAASNRCRAQRAEDADAARLHRFVMLKFEA